MKIKKIKSLRQLLIKEDIEGMVNNQGVNPEEQPILDVSIDQKVDGFLLQYEKNSLPQQPSPSPSEMPSVQESSKSNKKKNKTITEKYSTKNLLNFLFEVEGDDPTADPTVAPVDAPAPDLGGGNDPFGGTDSTTPVEKVPATPVPNINIDNFAKNVARLINDFNSLIDVKRIALNRSKMYIEKNYNAEIAKQMMDILSTNYDINPETLGSKYDDVESPVAVGANDSIENAPPEAAAIGGVPET